MAQTPSRLTEYGGPAASAQRFRNASRNGGVDTAELTYNPGIRPYPINVGVKRPSFVFAVREIFKSNTLTP